MADRGDQGKNPRTGQGAVQHTLHGHTPSSPRPLGTPSRVIIYPEGRVVEERQPLNGRPQPSPPVE